LLGSARRRLAARPLRGLAGPFVAGV